VWDASSGYGMHKRPDGPLDFPLGVRLPSFIEWTLGEAVEEFRKRIYCQLDRKILPQLRTLEQEIAMLPAVKEKRRPEHFEWLARHQIHGETPREIARHPSSDSANNPIAVDVPAVKTAILHVARDIGITQRPFGKPGRPRKLEK
jgi:hypothetical protein